MKITSNSTPNWIIKHAEENAPRTYKISNERIPWLKSQLERLNKLVTSINKRGAEFGAEQLPPIQVKVINDNIQIQDKTNPEVVYVGKEVQIIGKTPQIKGWQFTATIMPLADEQGNQANIIKSVPGSGPIPERYRTSVPKCDYCKQSRRRNETYLLFNKQTGEHKEIGRNCLAKFLNTSSPEGVADLAEAFANMTETLESFDEEFSEGGGGGGFGGMKVKPIGAFVANVIAVQRAAGWTSRSQAKQDELEGKKSRATADVVWDYMDPKLTQQVAAYVKKNHGKEIEHRPEDEELAKKVIQWTRKLRERAPESINDYLSSISSATSVPFVPQKLIGYVASIVRAYERNQASVGFFKGKVQNKSTTEQGTTAWLLKSDKGKDVVWFDAKHDAQADAMLDKAIADQSDVYFKGSFERTDSYTGQATGQNMMQAIVEKFLTPEEYAQENKEALEKERLAQEKLKTAPPVVPQQKTKMVLTVDKIKYLESDFGTKSKYEMTDDYGRKFFWMTSGSQELEEGKTYEANVTVGWEKLPGVNAPKLYCPEHPDAVLIPSTDPKKKNKSGTCPIDQKYQEKPLRKLAFDKYSNAIRLDKVEPLSTGGQALITKDDVGVINKQIAAVGQQAEALEGEMKPLAQERYELLKETGAETASHVNGVEELTKVKAVLAREIGRAQQAPQDQPFRPDYEGASYHLGSQFSTYRPITPEELLQEANKLREKTQSVIDAVKSFAPQAEQLANEWSQAQDWKAQSVKEKEMYKLVQDLETKYRYVEGASVEWPHIRDSFLGVNGVKQVVDFIKNPKGDFSRIDSSTQAATQALQSGTPMDIQKILQPSEIHFMKFYPLLPPRFIETAQKVLATISQVEPRVTEIDAKLTPMRQQKEALEKQSNELYHKMRDLEESRRLGRPRTAAWIKSIIRKS